VTADREWKRLYPVRFRHLSGSSSFKRWDWVTYKYRRPNNDARAESCHVFEDSIAVTGALAARERATLLGPMTLASVEEAAARGHSLALIRPRNTRFVARQKSEAAVEKQREAYRRAAAQTSILDKQLAELEPSPYEFRFKFEDDRSKHDYENGDWETHAMFWTWRQQHGEAETIRQMTGIFNEEYPRRGMAFAVGNQAKRPQTWQLLGVIRLDEMKQGELF
jgi:hypothetical protein